MKLWKLQVLRWAAALLSGAVKAGAAAVVVQLPLYSAKWMGFDIHPMGLNEMAVMFFTGELAFMWHYLATTALPIPADPTPNLNPNPNPGSPAEGAKGNA